MFKIKKNNYLILICVLFFSLMNSSVMARADVNQSYSVESVSNLTINATLGDKNFDGQIYFFINDSKGMKRVFVLNKNNNFSSTYELPVGKSKILNIEFYDKDKNVISLPYTYTGELNTTTGKAATFTIKVENNSLQDKEQAKTTNDSDNNSSEDNNQDTNKSTQEENTNNETKPIEKDNQENNITDTLRPKTKMNLAIDIVLLLIVGGAIFYYKYREYKKKRTEGKDE